MAAAWRRRSCQATSLPCLPQARHPLARATRAGGCGDRLGPHGGVAAAEPHGLHHANRRGSDGALLAHDQAPLSGRTAPVHFRLSRCVDKRRTGCLRSDSVPSYRDLRDGGNYVRPGRAVDHCSRHDSGAYNSGEGLDVSDERNESLAGGATRLGESSTPVLLRAAGRSSAPTRSQAPPSGVAAIRFLRARPHRHPGRAGRVGTTRTDPS
jgi:hypothetical protein